MPEITQDQIRDRAYALWEEAGKPEGRDWEFWMMAEEELAGRRRPDGDNNTTDATTSAVLGGLPTR